MYKTTKRIDTLLNIGLWILAFVIISNALAIHLPSAIFYGIILFSLVLFLLYRGNLRHLRFDGIYLLMIIVGLFSLFFNEINPIFEAYFRLFAFCCVVFLCSPLINNRILNALRSLLFERLLWMAILIVFFSDLLLAVGLVPLHSPEELFGGFRGVTDQSMNLAPFSAIAILFALYQFVMLKKETNFRVLKQFAYGVFILMGLGTLFYAASRSALGALAGAVIVFLYIYYGNKLYKLFRVLIIVAMLGALTYPLWSDAVDSLIDKQDYASERDVGSRTLIWASRFKEIEDRPILGVGMGTVDLSNANSGFHYGQENVESGSSWLFILSSTGIIGFILFVIIFVKDSKKLLFIRNKDPLNALYCSILAFFTAHMIFQGYIFSVGNSLVYYIFIVLTVLKAYKEDYELKQLEATPKEIQQVETINP